MRLLLGVLALLALVLVGLVGVWWLGGPDLHRWVAHRALELVLDRDVQVDGTLEVEFGAEPLVQLTRLRIDNPPWAKARTQLEIERARIQIALRPLLRRVLVFPLLTLEGVTVALETDADGRHSWQSDGAQAGTSPHSSIPLVDHLSVKDATVTYSDQRDGRRTELRLVSLIHQPGASGDRRLDAHGDIDGKAFRIKGTSGGPATALSTTDPYPLDLEIHLPSVEARLAGTIVDVARATGLDLRLEARSRSLLAATKAWGVSVQADAEVNVGARLMGDLALLSLADVRAEISSAGDRLEFAGGLSHVWDGTGLDGRVELKLDPAGPLGKLLSLGWRGLHEIEATASVAGSVAEVAFDDLSAEILGPSSRLTLAGSFRVATPGGARLEQFSMASRLEIARIADVADLLDVDVDGTGLGRFWFDGTVYGDGRHFDADGRAMLGETPFDGTLSGDLSGARPSFKGRLHSPRVRLIDLGLIPKASGDPTPAAQATIAAERDLFGREAFPLDSLQTLDLDLEVQLDSLEGIALAIDRAHAHVMLMEGRLQLSEVGFYVVDGYAEASAVVDVREPMPTWRIQVAINDIELSDIWRQLETDVPLSGELDLMLDLGAIGRSPQELASSASGDLGLALARGEIRSRLFDLTTMNPFRWLIARSTRRGYANINCFIARFQADHGVADLLTLVLDTPNVIAAGEGYIDFARETINLRIRPRAKRNRVVELATPFAIRGSLANPLVETNATGATARTLGRVAMSPVNLLGALLPFVNDRGRDQNNPCLTLSNPEAPNP